MRTGELTLRCRRILGAVSAILLAATGTVVVGAAQPAYAAADAGRMMIVGDSITHGSSGDWTWRYRLWKHLRANDVTVDLVGPRGDLENIMTPAAGDGDQTYADPAFDQDHNATWGRPLNAEASEIAAKTTRYDPDTLLVLLGINDLAWLARTPAQVEDDLRTFIANARTAKPTVRFVFGRLLPTATGAADAAFAAKVSECNQRLSAVAQQLSTAASPIAVAATDTDFDQKQFTWDGIHPNARGELRIAAAFADSLAQRFGIGTAYPRPFPDVTVGPQQAPQATLTGTGSTTADLAWTPSLGATQYWVWTQDGLFNKEWTRLPLPLSQDYNPWHITQLGAGITYRYKLQAAKGNDLGAFSNEVSITPTGQKPGTPGNFTVTAGDSQAVLRWTAAPDAGGYLVSVRNVTDGEAFRQLPWPVTGTSWTAANLENGVRYEFRLQAVNGALNGGTTPEVGVTLTGTVPAAPTVSATAGNGQATLSWPAVANATAYVMHTRNVTAGETGFTKLPIPIADTSWVAQQLVNGASYEFRVQPMNGRIAGGTSAAVAVRPSVAPPAKPTDLRASNGNGAVTLSWTEAPSASGYYIHTRNVTGGETVFTRLPWPVEGPKWTAEGLVNGASYEFRVQSVSGLIDGGTSDTVAGRPTVAPPPAPTGFTVNAGNGEATLRWTEHADATGYFVHQRNVTAGETGFTKLPYPVSGSGWVAQGLSNGATYQYKLQSVSGLIEGATSAAVTVTLNGPAPAAPSLTGRAGDRKALLSWSMPANANAFYIYTRNVTAGETGFTKLPWPVVDDAWTATGLVNGATYQYKVQAYNDLIAGGTSAAVTVSPAGPPAPGPENLSASSGNRKAVLKWAGSSRATGYLIWIDDGSGWRPLPYPVADDAWTASGLTNGADYRFRVQSVDGLDPGGFSNTVSVTPLGPTPQVANLRVTPQLAQANLAWSGSSTSAGYMIRTRDVTAGQASFNELPWPVTATSFTATLLTPGHVYEFQVVAVSGQQRGVTSNTVRVTLPLPAPVSSVTARPALYGLTLSWRAVPGADGYVIYNRKGACGETSPARSTMERLPYPVTGTSMTLSYLFTPNTCWFVEVVAMRGGAEAPRAESAVAVNYTLKSNDDSPTFDAVQHWIYGEMQTNARGAAVEQMRWDNDHGLGLGAAAGWAWLVRPGGVWDHKPQIRQYFGPGAQGGSNGATFNSYWYTMPNDPYEMYYDIWSNIHYGYVGMQAGFPAAMLREAHQHIGTTDAGDEHAVNLGILLWQQNGVNLSEATFRNALRGNIGQFGNTGKARRWTLTPIPNFDA